MTVQILSSAQTITLTKALLRLVPLTKSLCQAQLFQFQSGGNFRNMLPEMVRLLISIVLLALCLPPVMGQAVGTPGAVKSRYQGSGVRVTGATVTAREFHDKSAPWQKDILKQPLPNYP